MQEKIRVKFIFRKPDESRHSIEELFGRIIENLPGNIIPLKKHLPYHEGLKGKILNLKFILKEKADVFHITGDTTYIAAVLPKSKFITTFHDLGSLQGQNKIKNYLLKLFWVKIPAKRSAFVTVISRKTEAELKQIVKLPDEKIKLINNCIDDSWTCTGEENKETTEILFIGTKKNKNLERTIRALSGLDIKLIILGKPDNEQKELLAKYGIKHEIHVNLSAEEVRSLYRSCNIVLFPSLYEGFGLPVLEAQATGRALITSNIEPMKSIASGGALLVNPYNEKEIREAVELLMTDKELKKQIINKGLENVKNYSCKAVAMQYAQLYKLLTKNTQNG